MLCRITQVNVGHLALSLGLMTSSTAQEMLSAALVASLFLESPMKISHYAVAVEAADVTVASTDEPRCSVEVTTDYLRAGPVVVVLGESSRVGHVGVEIGGVEADSAIAQRDAAGLGDQDALTDTPLGCEDLIDSVLSFRQ